MIDELERIRKDAIVTKSRYCLGICLETPRKTMKVSDRMARVPAEIRTNISCIQVHQGLLRVDTGFAS
jgi:hypothetical protein